MNDEQLRHWAAKYAMVKEFPEELWRLIPHDLRRAAQHDEDARHFSLLPVAKALLRAARLGASGANLGIEHASKREDSTWEDSVVSELSEHERQRATAYSEYLARLAADEPLVRSIRKQLPVDGDVRPATEKSADSPTLNAQIRLVSRTLANNTPWNEEQAARFVLTGEVPEVVPIVSRTVRRSGQTHTYATVTLEIEPWVSPGAVNGAYVQAQKRALGGQEAAHKRPHPFAVQVRPGANRANPKAHIGRA